ncbi:CKLF-like MARVEL transmembrane domain-containing protein 6 [Chanos chanos]|uniref:CKLF-like MARVEL transmembrane domain-containing protein 6 n=1 Tax=Chanos chanos TaxID=29144 RepID=A0A6J2W2N2_CHACN|nr:CKLF-like MARVEL transmembrane domain-containing protein 6 [Chanos chanos]
MSTNATSSVYGATTEPGRKSKKLLVGPNEYLTYVRFFFKVFEVLFSLAAFIAEETITNCVSCSPLYFFEFVSCTAFLFTALLLVLLATNLSKKVGINCWPQLDFYYTAAITVLFLIASIVFLADNSGMIVERVAGVFGILASVVYILDLGLFCKEKGVPFIKRSPAQAQAQSQAPESEKLNTVQATNGGE